MSAVGNGWKIDVAFLGLAYIGFPCALVAAVLHESLVRALYWLRPLNPENPIRSIMFSPLDLTQQSSELAYGNPLNSLGIMDTSTFTIEFPIHLAEDRREYCLFHLRDLGAAVEQSGENSFVVSPHRLKELARIGHFLFHTHVASYTKVVAVSGAAELRASAYQVAA